MAEHVPDPAQPSDAERVEHDLIELIHESRPPTTPHDLGTYLQQLLRPSYHAKKIAEDFKAAKHALENRDLDQLLGNAASLAQALRGRLFATYFLVGPFGVLGPICGTVFQFTSALKEVAVISYAVTLLVGNVGTTIGFQIIWGFAHRRLYAGKSKVPFGGLLRLWNDIIPLQLQGFKLWVVANLVLLPVALLVLFLIDRFAPAFGKVVPVGVLMPALEIFFVHGTLIRLMGDLFERESRRIASHHATSA